MKELGYAYVANNKEELENLLMNKDLQPLHDLGESASQSLIDELHALIG